jgi:predicted secreted Zn-dependent protease
MASLQPSSESKTLDDLTALEGIPGVSIIYYNFTGSNIKEIAANLRAHRSDMPNHGHYYGYTTWNIGYNLQQTPDGCVFSGPINFSATIIMPRLAEESRLREPELEKWTSFISALARHEMGHVRVAYDNLEEVRRALVGETCREADQAGQRTAQKLREADAQYDIDTKHGATQGAVL